ncbi:hypothetical protein [uncultured Chryseobacterium sp.]|uniref:hypothetical protein n=1 Tax=uncultured Chryseobacterium sp. TaxID=259322 RepID=UPI0025E5306A|nr:hypothetical protein [uncultured Chryseobacterium sp.]
MKKKKDFKARFWSGTRKHFAVGLLETFFQFNSQAEVKETLSMMMQCSIQKNVRITKDPAEVFHLYQALRSLLRVCRLIGKEEKKGRFRILSKARFSKTMAGSPLEEEYRDPVLVFRNAFRTCSREEFDGFLSAMVYFSLGNSRCEAENRIIIPYLQLTKMLDAAWLIVERVSMKK